MGLFQFRYTIRFSIVFLLHVISVCVLFSGVNVSSSVTFVNPLSIITNRYICSLRYNKFLLHLGAFFALNIWRTCDCVVYLYKANGNSPLIKNFTTMSPTENIAASAAKLSSSCRDEVNQIRTRLNSFRARSS